MPTPTDFYNLESRLSSDELVRMLGNITASATLCAQLAEMQAAGLARDEHSSLAKAITGLSAFV